MSLARANELLFVAVLAALGIGCLAGLYLAIAQIPLHVLLDPNEGWNAYHALAVATRGELYPGPPSLIINNYPPLSFYLIGCSYAGDFIIAGRLFSVLVLLVGSVQMFQLARTMGAARKEALFAPLLLAATLLVTSDYVGMDDPQLLGHVIALCALYALLSGGTRDTVGVGFSALLFVLAGFMKHNLFVLPLATTLWLLLQDWRATARFVAFGLGFALIGLAWFRLAYGSDLLSFLNSARTYSSAAALAAVSSWLEVAIVPLAGLLLLVVLDRKNPYVQLVGLWAGIGTAVGAVFSGGAGVDVNAFFDADFALAFSSALLLMRLREHGHEGIAAAALAAPLVLVLYLAWSPDWLTAEFWRHPGADDAETANTDIAFLKAHPGPALCDTLALCYWAGKKAEVDVFNMGEAYKAGARSDDLLAGLIHDKYYAAVQFETLSPFPLTKRVHDALLANYRIDHTDDDGVFLVAR